MPDAGDQVWAEQVPETVPAGVDRFRCPGCDEEVDVPAEAAGELVRCPYCRTDFFADHNRSAAAVVDDTPAATEADREGELSTLRIRQVLALRRGAMKSRSMWVIAAFLAGTTALDFGVKAALYVRGVGGWGPRPTVFAAVVVVAVAFAGYALRRAAAFRRELDRTALPEPATPPDFGPLGDGADRWRLLDEVR